MVKEDSRGDTSGAWAEPVPEEVLSKPMKLKYFRETYEPYGLKLEQFNRHPSTRSTAKEFSKATNDMGKFAAESLKGK